MTPFIMRQAPVLREA
ncbi:unnamed protein product [Linum tenue]|uniref:Uncharacterized protein n=1 Tax=Linum tenue TaxID=586396 RepID=A0AAV0RNW2_9ROSI|nr:unnamed protein product [Linum tenue]